MRWINSFGSSLLFAALVAAGYPFYLAINQHVFGHHIAFAIYLLGSAAIYLLGIARRPVHGLGAAFAIICAGGFMIGEAWAIPSRCNGKTLYIGQAGVWRQGG